MKKDLENAVLWVATDAGSYKLADCKARIEISEGIQTLKLPKSNVEYNVKTYNAAIVICSNMNFENNKIVDVNLLKRIRRFDLYFDSVMAKFKDSKTSINGFADITPVEIDLNGEWRFNLTNDLETIKGFFPDLIFST